MLSLPKALPRQDLAIEPTETLDTAPPRFPDGTVIVDPQSPIELKAWTHCLAPRQIGNLRGPSFTETTHVTPPGWHPIYLSGLMQAVKATGNKLVWVWLLVDSE